MSLPGFRTVWSGGVSLIDNEKQRKTDIRLTDQ